MTIAPGSLIFFYANRTSSLIDKLISWWEGGNKPFHVGMIMYNSLGDTLVLQADPHGNFCVPITDYDGYTYEIITPPGWLQFDWPFIFNWFSKLEYSFTGAALAGLEQYIRIPILFRTKKAFCSEAAILMWKKSGYQFNFPNDIVDPYVLLKYLKRRK